MIIGRVNVGICDDDQIIRMKLEKTVYEFFERMKREHQIKVFENGEKMLAQAEDYNIVFLDMYMPGMNGDEVGKILRKSNQQCKIIVVTGATPTPDLFQLDIFRFIGKPFENRYQ